MAKSVSILGGGPSGMIAAGIAASRGNDVTIYERNAKLGRKLAITGKGRCNITNNCEIEDLIANVPTNSNFLYSAFYTFSNEDTITFFNNLGLQTKVERGGRVFPVSDNAFHVIDALKKFLTQNEVKIEFNSMIENIVKNDDKFNLIKSDKTIVSCDSVIIATGGASYKGTGSDGTGYTIAKGLGHTITDIKPSLVPLEVFEDNIAKSLQGLSLKNVSIKILKDKKKLVEDFGEMLFTHYGVSGPIILSSSSHIAHQEIEGLKLVIDLKPALDEEALDLRLQRDFQKNLNKHFGNSLNELLPSKLIPVIVELSGINQSLPVNQITKQQRKELAYLVKNLVFTIKKTRPIDEAIITSGGVKTTEINPSTMESKIVQNLFFAGEVIDVDAYTGGFNLQIAFSTGYLAGINC